MKISEAVLKAVEQSPSGIANLDVLQSLRLCGAATLKTTLSRLRKQGRIIRLKRGTYASNPPKDAYACAQATFNGYLGFSTALYLHELIAEIPFTITVVTTATSRTKAIGEYTFRAVALREKAVGFKRMRGYSISTRAKTLFDCLYLPRHSLEERKLLEAFRDAALTESEWAEFEVYVKKFASGGTAKQMLSAEMAIRGGRRA